MHSLTVQIIDIWRLRALLRLMTVREVRSRFTGTVLGWVWLYTQPVLTVVAYYVVFDVVFKARLGAGAPTQSLGVYLVVGLVPWIAFSDAVSRAMISLVEAGSLLQKNALAPVLFPARAVAASAVTYFPLILLLALCIVMIGEPSLALFWLPAIIAIQFLLAFLLGYALAILAAALRDTLQVAGFLLSLGVFASPVLFTMNMFPEGIRWILWLNPMTPVVLAYHSIILSGQAPSVTLCMALLGWLLGAALLLNHLIRRSGEHLVDWL